MLNFSKTLVQFDQFLWGAGVTLFVSLLGALFGMAVGLALVFLRDAKWRPVRFLAHLYISFVRGTPLLVQIFLVYYALPGPTGIDLAPFTAGVLALSLNSGAFASEIFRAGLSQIPPGQYEAADALGLHRAVIWFKVILPQVRAYINSANSSWPGLTRPSSPYAQPLFGGVLDGRLKGGHDDFGDGRYLTRGRPFFVFDQAVWSSSPDICELRATMKSRSLRP